jgi:hypothetical protein
VNSTLTNKTDTLLPFYLNYLGGNWSEATQCLIAGNNGWDSNHGALNADRNNKWALANTPWSWGYFKRADLPVHFAIAEGWTVGDMYQVCLALISEKLMLMKFPGVGDCLHEPKSCHLDQRFHQRARLSTDSV